MASKKKRDSCPARRRMASARAGEVSGPVATTATGCSSPLPGREEGRGGRSVTSSRRTVMFGWLSIASVTARLKASRSTANAPPAGTAVLSAQAITNEPSRRNSFLRRPRARSGRLEPRLFEQTSSAMPAVWCAGVMR